MGCPSPPLLLAVQELTGLERDVCPHVLQWEHQGSSWALQGTVLAWDTVGRAGAQAGKSCKGEEVARS